MDTKRAFRSMMFAVLAIGCGAGSARAADGTWDEDLNSNWTNATMWAEGIIANGVDSTASFVANFSGNRVVTNNPNGTTWSGTIGNFYFNDPVPSGSGIFIGALTDTASIALAVSSGSIPVINTASGTGNYIRVVLTGSQGMVKTGAGTLVLTKMNTYTGTTSLNQGAIRIQTANSLNTAGTLQIGSGGTFDLFGQNQTVANLMGSGTVTNSSVSTNSILTVDSAVSGTFSGVIQNGGATAVVSVAKAGTGSWTLAGNHTYTGATTVTAGTMVLTGALTNTSAVTVDANATLVVNGSIASGAAVTTNGTLMGSGLVGGATTVTGTLSPGNSPGVLTFGNGLTLADDSDFAFELTANTAAPVDRGVLYDGVNVTNGGLTLGNSVAFHLTLGGSVDFSDVFWTTNQSWLVFDLGSGVVTGSFASILVEGISPSGGFFSLNTIGNDVRLNWTAVPEPSAWVLVGISGMTLLLRRKQRSSRR